MATENRDAGAAPSDGDKVTADKSSTEDFAIGVDEETPAAAASGDRDASVGLLVNEIRGLKQERSDLLSERSGLEVALSDAQAKLAGTVSELKKVADRASLLEEQLPLAQKELYAAKLSARILEEQLRIAQKDLSAAKLAAEKNQVELLQLESSKKNLQAALAKVTELENKIKSTEEELKVSEEELKVSEQKHLDKDAKFHQRELEVTATIEELHAELATEKEKSRNISSKNDSKVPLMQSQALGAAAIVGSLALAAGAVVYLRLPKRT